MKILAALLVTAACCAAEFPAITTEQRIEYWKLRAVIAEANAAFAGSLTAEQKKILETIRSKSTDLHSLQEDMSKSCGTTISFDSTGSPVCESHSPNGSTK